MRTIDEALKLDTKESLLAELKEHVAVRSKMGGALYWNVINDECLKIAEKCLSLGCNRQEVGKIFRG